MKNKINRWCIIIVVISLGFSYLYYKTLLFYDVVSCYSYGLNVYQARPTIFTIKYFYKYEDKYYFDQARYTSSRKAIPSSAAQVRVCKLKPAKNHLVANNSGVSSNHYLKIRKPFVDTFNVKINNIRDYYPKEFKRTSLQNKKTLIYPKTIDNTTCNNIINALNKVVFCEGSLIEKYIVNKKSDSYTLYLIQYYVNDFSLDSKLVSVYHMLLKESLKKDVAIVVIDKNKISEQKIYTTQAME